MAMSTNKKSLHSSRGYMTSLEFEELFVKKNTQKIQSSVKIGKCLKTGAPVNRALGLFLRALHARNVLQIADLLIGSNIGRPVAGAGL